MNPTTPAAAFAALGFALLVAHQVGDHWIQTHKQACTKGAPGLAGHLACAGHVATYTLTGIAAVLGAAAALGLHLDPAHAVAGFAVSAGTHYLADRRTPLRRLAKVTGRAAFYDLGAPRPGRDDNPSLGTGAYALDQSFHYLFLGIAALIMALP